MKKIFLPLFVLICLGVGCLPVSRDPEIVGTWKNINNPSEILTFGADGGFNYVSENGISLQDTVAQSPFPASKVSIKYETNVSAVPHELSVVIKLLSGEETKPFGIYKIEGNKLIFQFANLVEQQMFGIEVGEQKTEFPEDFNETAKTFELMHY